MEDLILCNKKDSIICNKIKNNKVCNQKLQPNDTFCSKCGIQIDKKLFDNIIDKDLSTISSDSSEANSGCNTKIQINNDNLNLHLNKQSLETEKHDEAKVSEKLLDVKSNDFNNMSTCREDVSHKNNESFQEKSITDNNQNNINESQNKTSNCKDIHLKDQGTNPSSKKHNDSRSKNKLIDKKSFKVYFYVFISNDIFLEIEHDKNSIYITFEQIDMGGWNSKDHKMEIDRKVENGYVLKKCLNINYENFNENSIPYKYCFYNKEIKIDEYLKDTKNRLLRKDLILNLKDWHQFDGIMNMKPNNNIFKKIFNRFIYKDKISENMIIKSFEVMLPSWKLLEDEDLEFRGNEFLLKVDQVINSFYKGSHCGDTVVEVLKEYCSNVIKSFPSDLREIQLIKSDKGSRLAKALCLLYLYRKYKVPIDKDNCNQLSGALLLRLDDDNCFKCSEYELISEYIFDKNYLKELSLHLESLLQEKKLLFKRLYFISFTTISFNNFTNLSISRYHMHKKTQ